MKSFTNFFFGAKSDAKVKQSLRSPDSDYLFHVENLKLNSENASSLTLILESNEVAFLCPSEGLPVRVHGPVAENISEYIKNDGLERVFFVHLSGKTSAKFGVPYFEVFDGILGSFSSNLAVRGEYSFVIDDVDGFVRLNRLRHFNVEEFSERLKSSVIQHVKKVVTNLPSQSQVSVLHLEKQIDLVSEYIFEGLSVEVSEDFGIKMTRLRIVAIEPERDADNYASLIRMTRDTSEKLQDAETNKKIQDIASLGSEEEADDEIRQRIDF